jgi:glutaredoxin
MSIPKPSSVSIGARVAKESLITEPLYLYGMEGCDACGEAAKLCKKYGVKYKAFLREDHEDDVVLLTNGYDFVPVIINSQRVFIGGLPELAEALKLSDRKKSN